MPFGLHRAEWRGAVAAFIALSVLGAANAVDPAVALLLAPALVLLAVLAVGVYPAERAIARARARRMHARPGRGPVRIAPRVRCDIVRPTGVTRAFALAVRPPPYAA